MIPACKPAPAANCAASQQAFAWHPETAQAHWHGKSSCRLFTPAQISVSDPGERQTVTCLKAEADAEKVIVSTFTA
jgi:hypothetical protein